MSMGYCAEHSVIIHNDKLGEVIGKSAADNLMDMLSKVDGIYVNDTYVNHVFDPDNYSGEVSGVTGEENRNTFLKALDTAVNSALETIRAKTGITAYLSYHDPETGDSYDDVQGFFVELRYEECITPTPAYHKLEKAGIAFIAHYTVFC